MSGRIAHFLFTGATFFGGETVKGDLAAKVKEATSDLLEGLSLELVDVHIGRERGSTLVRIAVDKAGGVDVEDCAGASRLIGQVLDREEVVEGRYLLEVTSPGIRRELQSPEEYRWSVGKTVKIRLREPLKGKTTFRGTVREAGREAIVLDTGEERLEIEYEVVSSAVLDPDLPW
jgi:ribosome maturation factor RimP